LTLKNLAIKEFEDKENNGTVQFTRRKFIANLSGEAPPMLTPVPASKRSTTHLDNVIIKPNN